jgi:hypothetical protein
MAIQESKNANLSIEERIKRIREKQEREAQREDTVTLSETEPRNTTGRPFRDFHDGWRRN